MVFENPLRHGKGRPLLLLRFLKRNWKERIGFAAAKILHAHIQYPCTMSVNGTLVFIVNINET
jgi:hypothetical protein